MRRIRFSVACLVPILFAMNSAAKTPVFHFVQCPGSADTSLRGINNHGIAVGYCADSNNLDHGFILDRNGLTIVDHPSGAYGTLLEDINKDGVVVGTYIDNSEQYHGFVYENGSFSDIGPPNAVQTLANAIDDFGRMGGEYVDTNDLNAGWIFDGTNYRTIFPNFLLSAVTDINVHDTFLVVYSPFAGILRSSSCSPSGCSKIEIPGAVYVHARGINSSGTISLEWRKSRSEDVSHGAILVGPRVVKFDAPGCDSTFVGKINDKHVVVGSCLTGIIRQGYYVTLN